jgi:signal transduction histidine kinase
VVVLTGCDDEDLAISALQQGAQDYLVKGVDDGLLIRSVRYAIERTRAETKLEESQEALLSTQMHLMQVEKLDSVGRLAAGIAHEIRNPLAVIQMGVDVLRQSRFGTEKTSKEILTDMSEAIQRAGSIISGLLDFCMPTPLAWTPASINHIVEEALVMLTHELRIAEVDLTLSLQEDLPELNLDHHRMQEVVITLVINALDAMSPKGNLKIATSLQLLDDAHPLVRAGSGIAGTSVVLLEVLDSGTGIPRDVLGKIFDPFFTTKQVGQGTGLGLSICKNIVELHGGKITLENRREGGARASILFVV